MQCGITPAAMIGHSIGEYVAACLAGVFSLNDALALVAERGRLIQSMPSGAMLAVALSAQDLNPLLSSSVSIAAINSDNQTVASGPTEEIARLEEVLSKKKILCKRLRTSHAFHSPMMDPIVGPFVERVGRVNLKAPSLRYLSNVSGTWITAAQACDPKYWGTHLRNAVRFGDCARSLLSERDCALLEVGPGETLGSLMRARVGPNSKGTIIPSIRHALAASDDRGYWLAAIGKLWLKNVRVDWKGVYVGERRMRVSLPTYPFDRQRYWIEPAKAQAVHSESAIPQKKTDIADWFYAPSWKRALAGPALKNEKTCNWLVFAGSDTVSQQLISELEISGLVFQVRAGSTYQVISPSIYELRPQSLDDHRALLRDLIAREVFPEKIVYFWKPELPDCGVLASMCLVQALDDIRVASPIELNVIGNRAYSIFGEPISSPAPGALNAFWSVVSLECPNIKSRTIDVELDSDKGAVTQILSELRHRAVDRRVAYRGNGRWLPIYDPVRIERTNVQDSDKNLILRQHGIYVITGGLGGVGLVLGRHIARKTQGRIVLLSRTPLPPESEWDSLTTSATTPDAVKQKIKGLQSIVDVGGQVVAMAVDVSDVVAMGKVMADVHSRYGTVHGIIHAAGVAGAGMIQEKSQEQVLSILSSKVQGTEWLRAHLPATGLDFVMLCSSISAVTSNLGLSVDAAANAYLDGFATAFDDPAGTRVLAVNWDIWREVGMAANAAVPQAFASLREDTLKHAIRPEEAEEVFDRLLEFPVSQIVVSTRDLPALQKMDAHLGAALREAAPEIDTEKQLGQEQGGELSASEDGIERFVVALWQEFLGVNPVGIHDNFFELGGHSLMGIQVLSRVRDRFGVNMPLRSVFEAVTPAEFAQRIRVMRWAENPSRGESDIEREEIEI
jgi:acyl transferase domain-containing protein/acyl carrier protein